MATPLQAAARHRLSSATTNHYNWELDKAKVSLTVQADQVGKLPQVNASVNERACACVWVGGVGKQRRRRAKHFKHALFRSSSKTREQIRSAVSGKLIFWTIV